MRQERHRNHNPKFVLTSALNDHASLETYAPPILCSRAQTQTTAREGNNMISFANTNNIIALVTFTPDLWGTTTDPEEL